MNKILKFKSNTHKLNMGELNKNCTREIVFKKGADDYLTMELSALNGEFSLDEIRNKVLSSTVMEYKLANKTPKEEVYESIKPLFSFNNKDNYCRVRILLKSNEIQQVVVEPTYLVSCTYLKA